MAALKQWKKGAIHHYPCYNVPYVGLSNDVLNK